MTRRAFCCFIFIFLFIFPPLIFANDRDIFSLATDLSQKISNTGFKTVAVVDFTDLNGNATELGRFIAEELSGEITNITNRFEVIDRNHLKAIMNEHKLSTSGLGNPDIIKKLGKITGADLLITGVITPFGDTVRISSKALSATTARVIASSKCNIPKTKAIDDLLRKNIEPSVSSVVKTSKYSIKKDVEYIKTVGDLKISVKQIKILKDRILVLLDFFNNSNGPLYLGAFPTEELPYLSDDQGNSYSYKSGLFIEYELGWQRSKATLLNPMSSNDVTLFFNNPLSMKTKAQFSLTLNYVTLWFKDMFTYKFRKHSVSFTNIEP